MESWLIEFAYGIGKLFVHPFLYLFIICSLIVGYYRVKKERKNFSTSVYDMLYELRTLLGASIGLGIVASIFTVGLGLVVPMNILIFIATGTIIFSLSFLFRFTSPVYTVAIAVAAALFYQGGHTSLLNYDLGTSFSVVSLAGIVGLLLIVEVCLLKLGRNRLSSPAIVKGKRGKRIGVQNINRLCLIPLLLLVPVGEISSFASWWPMVPIGESGYALFLFPFSIGLVHRMRATVPKEYISKMVTQIRLLAILVILLAIVSYWYNLAGYVALGVGLLGKILIDLGAASTEKNKRAYFTERDGGLVVLGVIPHSPAEKMGIQVGEMVTKVNGMLVRSADDYYQALQQNRAFCKLEVNDVNGEPRLMQSALYEGEHYELGLLYLHGSEKNESKE